MSSDGALSVKVRMYRQGLGDCHLVTILRDDVPVHRMLIDCGVYQTVSGGAELMRKIVANVIDETGGHIDVLAVTHEHWDHVSGFNQAKALFAAHDDENKAGKLTVGAVWMGWTEDPADPLARRIVTDRGAMLRRVAAAGDAATTLAAAGWASATVLANGIDGVLGFFGGARRTTADALAFARSLVATPRYCRPTDAPVTLVAGVRSYVLGPPLDPARLYQLLDDDETYGMAASRTETALADAFDAASAPADTERSQPFDHTLRHRAPFLGKKGKDGAGDGPGSFFDNAYWGADEDGQDQSWRRIDGDWLSGSRQFALKLDNATNNTSLVIALELDPSGRTLLFAADAQVGSWLSWDGLGWDVDGRHVGGADLLTRTSFLKVGHHGSHNATLRAKGLETMAEDLIAFIPTDEVVAKKVGWGRMPLPSLVTALGLHTKGRVVRADQAFTPVPAGGEVAEDFARRLKQTDLYYEIEFAP
jgi:hypothetical protein